MKSLVLLIAITLSAGIASAKTKKLINGEYIDSVSKSERIIEISNEDVISSDEYYYFRVGSVTVPDSYQTKDGDTVGGLFHSLIQQEGTNKACLRVNIEIATIVYKPICPNVIEYITEMGPDGKTPITRTVVKKGVCPTERAVYGSPQTLTGARVKKSDIITTTDEITSDKCFELPTEE